MNYATLSQMLQDYTQNYSSEFVAAIPEIVKLAEDRIYQSVQIPALKKVETFNLTANNKNFSVPNDFLSPYSMAVITDGAYNYMLEKEAGYLNEAFPVVSYRGVPRFYSIIDEDTIAVAPTPGSAYSIELYYFYEPESIVTAGTSWLGDNAESVLFYGALVEAYTYMKGDNDLIALYTARYAEVLQRLKNLGEGLGKRDNFRVDAPRIQVT
jgi:hypothetical protein